MGKSGLFPHPLHQTRLVQTGCVHLGETEAAQWSISAAKGTAPMSTAITRDLVGPAGFSALFPSAGKGFCSQRNK